MEENNQTREHSVGPHVSTVVYTLLNNEHEKLFESAAVFNLNVLLFSL